jgi:hypothetical protein
MKKHAIETIHFTYKKQQYEFSREIIVPIGEDYNFCEWSHKCYESVGGNKKNVTKKEMTHSHWNFWVRYID